MHAIDHGLQHLKCLESKDNIFWRSLDMKQAQNIK